MSSLLRSGASDARSSMPSRLGKPFRLASPQKVWSSVARRPARRRADGRRLTLRELLIALCLAGAAVLILLGR